MIGKSCYCIWWWTLLLKNFSDAITVNVALRQSSGKFCLKQDVSEKVFDGDTNYLNSDFMDAEDCLDKFLVVTLNKRRYMQFFVVFHGEGHPNQLDFFSVDMSNPYASQFCGYYSQKTEVLGRGMRVNCMEFEHRFFNTIRVITKNSGSYHIAELEAHTFALESEPYVMLHQGCYARFKGSTAEISLEQCQTKCFDEDTTFFAIKANKSCICGNDLEEETILANKDCNIKCPSLERYCGGENAFSVYMMKVPLPSVRSCYKATIDFSSAKKMNLTIEKCLQECSKHKYFAMLSGDLCLCLDSLPSTVTDFETDCTTQCSGDRTRLCGGKTGMSVMQTCKYKDSKITCDDILRCNGEYDMFGVCISGCKSGYVGKHCLQKTPDIDKVPDLGLTTITNVPLIATARDDDTNGTDDINKSGEFMETLKMVLLIVIVLLSAIGCYGMIRKRSKSVHSEGSQASAGARQVPPGDTSQVPPGDTSQVPPGDTSQVPSAEP